MPLHQRRFTHDQEPGSSRRVSCRRDRRHDDRVGRAHRGQRRHRLARRHFPSDRTRELPEHRQLRSVRQGAPLQRTDVVLLAADDRRPSRRPRGVHRSVPGLRAGRPREVGPRRIRVRPGRHAWHRTVARLPPSAGRAGDPGLLRVHRVDRRPVVEQRQGRAEWGLLLRHDPVAGRSTPATAPRRHLRLGRSRRRVPRRRLPRRNPLRVQRPLVRSRRSERRRRGRRPQPAHRPAGLRRRHPHRQGARRTALRLRTGPSRPSAPR